MPVIQGGNIIAGAVQRGQVVTAPGTEYYVDGVNGVDTNAGTSWETAVLTVQAAVNKVTAGAGDSIYVKPGSYNEAVTVGPTRSNVTIVGIGGRGSVYIAPSATNATALTNNAEDITLVNVGLEGDGTGSGLINTGKRFRAYGCKIEGGAVAAKMTLHTVAQEAAGTHGDGSDCWLVDTEICWSTLGIQLAATDYGGVTQLHVVGCTFHNCTTAAFEETGGSAAVRYFNLHVADCTFLTDEDGTVPSFLLLNDDNANTGIVTRCSFPTAINSGKSLASTKLLWVSNYHTGGVSTGQPS